MVTAQAVSVRHESDLIPLDPQVRYGKLQNGFTYYIRHVDNPEKTIEMRLIVKAGRLNEDEDQLGVAHFVEHMAFRATVNYPDGVRRSTDENGLSRNIDASTGYATRYKLAIPAKNDGLMANGLRILHDWAGGLLLKPDEIETERGVVLAESRRTNYRLDMLNERDVRILSNDKYSQEFRLRTDDCVRTCTAESLIRFYNDWYRPDLQAAIVVGDVDVSEVENRIKASFSDLKNPAHPRVKKNIFAPYKAVLTKTNQLIIITREQMRDINLAIYFKKRAKDLVATRSTVAGYRSWLIDQLYNEMMKGRMHHLTEKYNAPYTVITHSIVRNAISEFAGIDALSTFAVGIRNPAAIEPAFKSAITEMERVRRFGFSEKELIRAKGTVVSTLKRSYENIEAFIQNYTYHFLFQQAAPSPVYEKALVGYLLNSITLDTINDRTKESIHYDNDTDIVVMAPNRVRQALPDQKTIEKWTEEARHAKMTAYHATVLHDHLPDTQAKNGNTTVSETLFEQVGIKELTLDNGIKILLKAFKPDENVPNKIFMDGFHPGGAFDYERSDYYSALFSAAVIRNSGVGGWDKFTLNTYLRDKDVDVYPYVNDREVGIKGVSSMEDFVVMLQLMRLYLISPNRSPEAFDDWMAGMRINLRGKQESEKGKYEKAILSFAEPNNPELTLGLLSQVTLEKCFKHYRERFSDLCNFTFVLVGAFDPKNIEPQLLKYLGSLPCAGQNNSASRKKATRAETRSEITLHGGDGKNIPVTMLFLGSYTASPEGSLNLNILQEVLKLALRQRLRVTEGGTYSVSVSLHYDDLPDGRFRLRIDFDGNVENVTRLIDAARQELLSLRENGPNPVILKSAIAAYQHSLSKALKTYPFWLEYVKTQSRSGRAFKEILQRQQATNNITVKTVKAAANEYLNEQYLTVFKMLPR